MIFTLVEILKNTVLVTCLVMTMLLFIEYINVATRAKSFTRLRQTKFQQLLIAILLGIIPGCIGGFATVSLFTHGVVNFGALVASMIASLGDEAFVMFAIFPQQALILQAVLIIVALLVGVVINLSTKQFSTPLLHEHLALHDDEHEHCGGANAGGNWKENLQHLSLQRALLLSGLLFFILATFSGILEHAHFHGEECAHHHEHNFLFSERWLNLLFSALAIVVFVIIVRVNEHFLEHHLWQHVIKKHFLKLFLWTLGALIVIALLQHYIGFEEWVRHHPAYILLAAILIGLIPSSGPHLVFVLMFAQGSIPFSILLVNSLMQDGHAGLPLLAETKRGFIYLKLIKFAFALLIGGLGWWLHF
ncbi:MAG: putative manganese transporter [Bacteroidales bacterium]